MQDFRFCTDFFTLSYGKFMSMKKSVFTILLTLCCAVLSGAPFEIKTAKDSGGRTYEYIPDDPFSARIYTLRNGMKLYLSRNEKEPRIQTRIAVRAGSADDPVQSTGLAHYFEHMMFKGNSKIASLDWKKEEPLLEQIEQLFEQHRAEKDPAKRTEIYNRIDKLSQEAAKYSNDEYWLLTQSLGAKGTNAYTAQDETVYLNDIPASKLEKFLKLESERFSSIALRRFHTELESVYEEFNMTQDNDSRLAYQKLMSLLYPEHPYGRAIIGLPEHLKAPSMKDINTFFQDWYTPDNMALILSGAIDYDKTAELADKYFGAIPRRQGKNAAEKALPPRAAKEKPLNEVLRADITGPQAEMLYMGFRFEASEENELMLDLIGEILKNGKCGLFDKNVILPQKVLGLQQGCVYGRNYFTYLFTASPKQGQTLKELEDIILAELKKLQNGEFPTWLPGAVVNNLRLSRITASENRETAAYFFTDSFIREYPFTRQLNAPDKMEKITKQQIMDFAKKHFRADNYAVVYKHSGKAKNRIHAEKPSITPVPVSGEISVFAKEFAAMPDMPDPEPVFPDLKKEIIRGGNTYMIRNRDNERFHCSIVYQIGHLHDLKTAPAFALASYLGTEDMTAAELQEELYKLAGSIRFSSDMFTSTVTVSGLQRNYDPLMKLFRKMQYLKPDENAWNTLRQSILKQRENAKKDQWTIFDHAFRYSYYKGLDNLANLYLPEEELNRLTAKDLTGFMQKLAIKNLADIVYYGPDMPDNRTAKILALRGAECPKPVKFKADPPKENQVILVDYPSVQVIARVARPDAVHPVHDKPHTFASVFGAYGYRKFWSVIREERGLAYSTGAFYTCPTIMLDDWSSSGAYVMTQPDKLVSAIDAMLKELNEPVLDETVYAASVQQILSSIRNKRIQPESYYGVLKDMKRRGLTELPGKKLYRELQTLSEADFITQWQERISNKPTLLIILGDLKKIDRKALEKYGKTTELKIGEIFRK